MSKTNEDEDELLEEAFSTVPGVTGPGAAPLPFRPSSPPAWAPPPPPAPITPRTASPWAVGEASGKQRPSWTPADKHVPSPPATQEPPTPVPAAPQRSNDELVELVWLDRAALSEMRTHFRDIVEDSEPADEADADVRDVLEVLRRADPEPSPQAAIDGALGRDRSFQPPLAVLRGQLSVELDAVEVLRGTHAMLQLLPGGKQTEVLEDVARSLANPIALELDGHAEGLLAHLRQDYGAANRAALYNQALTAAERRAIAQRALRRLTVLGEQHACARLVRGNEASIVYLPQAAVAMLPPVVSFHCVLLAHVHPSQELGASSPSLKARAIARTHRR